jgi:putative transposase
LTYIRTWEGWLYLVVVVDAFSLRVVGFALADHMRADLCVFALPMAVQLRNAAPGLIHHSDRGSQYVSTAYQDALDHIGAICNMSGTGNCYDNAAVESFFSTLKQELIYRHTWPTRRHAMAAIQSPITSRISTTYAAGILRLATSALWSMN